ncbi:hypothetical protein, partial [Thermus filiformis]
MHRGVEGGRDPRRYELRVAERAVSVRLRGRFQSRPPKRDPGPLVRRHMGASLRRLAEATWLLEGHATPSHMLTL